MENNQQPNAENRFSRKKILIWTLTFLAVFGGTYLFLTASLNKKQRQVETEATPTPKICCERETIPQATDESSATAEAQTVERERDLATAVAQVATIEAERDTARQKNVQLRARELAASSQGVRKTMPQRSLLLALEALQETSMASLPIEPAAENAFFRALSNIGGTGLHGHAAEVTAVATSPDGRWLATASQDATVRLWDLTSDIPSTAPIVLPGHQSWRDDLAISANSRWLATIGSRGTINLWDLTNIDQTATLVELQGHEYDVIDLTFSPDNQWLISGSSDDTIRFWRPDDPKPDGAQLVLTAHDSDVKNVVISPDNHWLFTSSDNTLIRWDLTSDDITNSRTMLPLTNSPIPPRARLFPQIIEASPNGRWLAVDIFDGIDSNVKVWDLSSPDSLTPAFTLVSDLSGGIAALTGSTQIRGVDIRSPHVRPRLAGGSCQSHGIQRRG